MENTDTSLVCEQNQRQWKKKAHGFGLWGVLRVFCLLGEDLNWVIQLRIYPQFVSLVVVGPHNFNLHSLEPTKDDASAIYQHCLLVGESYIGTVV